MVFDAPRDGAFESGMRELDSPLPQHGHHSSPVTYITEDPGEIHDPSDPENPEKITYLEEPPCPTCERGTLTREHNAHGQMLTCRNGCSARFWMDSSEPLQGAQKGAPE